MLRIGCHLSASGGFLNMARTAVSLGADTFQFFTRNPRGGKAKDIDPDDVSAFLSFSAEHSIFPILAHAPYTLNPAAKEERIYTFAEETFADDLKRMDNFPGNYYNFHPGSHVSQGTERGIELITGLLNKVLREDQKTTVLLETMAGKGSEIGSSFDELAEIIKRTELKDKIGVCLDTCHVYDAGYDIADRLDDVLDEFGEKIGLGKLFAVHLNDSRNPFLSHKDRHEKIGEGSLGIEAFRRIINHEKLRSLPFYLETPNELDGYKKEIELLKSLYEE